MAHRLLLALLLAALAIAGCDGDDNGSGDPPPPTTAEPRSPGQPPDRQAVFAKLPPPRYLDQHPPECCPGLTGGWQFPYVAFPGDEVTATLSSPGPDPDNPPRVEVNADVVFRVSLVTARGKRRRVVREKRVRVDVIETISEPYLTVALRDRPPAYYALELELHPDDGSAERYVSYMYLSPPGEPAVELKLDRTSAEPEGTLELTVHNQGTARLEYGVAYQLEHWTGDWEWINRDDAFIALLKVAEPGKREREEIGLPGDLNPGRYRIVKSFTAPPSDRELDASVEFTVR